MTTFAPHRDTVESFVDCHARRRRQRRPFRNPRRGRGDVRPARRRASHRPRGSPGSHARGRRGAADLTYKEVLSGETHHAAYFRLQIEDTVVNGMDYILLDADGKIAEVTIWWRPLPAGVQMQRHLAGLLGMQPWELLTHDE